MPAVLFERRDHIALITLNRPEAHNALDPESMILLARAWEQVRDDDDIRVAVLTGSGTESFCAGADLARMTTLISGVRKPEDEWDMEIFKDIFVIGRALLRDIDTRKPVILAANGHAIAGGMEILQGTDIRIVAEHAQLGLQEVKWGLFPVGGSTVRLPRMIPHAIAMEMLLTGNLIPARRAAELGLVNHVVPAERVLPLALEIAAQIADNGPLAVREIRRSVRECIGLPEKDALDKEKVIGAPVFFSQDAREGPRAFKEKRKPRFVGK